jgi:hypothetical protein
MFEKLTREQIESMRRFHTGAGNLSYTVSEKMMMHALCDLALKGLETTPPEVAQLLQAQEHAIACGNLALELQSALAMLKNACDEAGWPKTAEKMAPMNMARAVLKKKLETTPSPLARRPEEKS